MFAQSYAKYYDRFNQDKPYKKEINFVYKWADKPKSILDIGCGTASYWKYYKNVPILRGIEKSTEMIGQSSYKNYIHYFDICNASKSNLHYWYFGMYDCVTALFDVINYIPDHKWWKNLPLKKDGYFIFDIWDKTKVDAEGFKQTIKGINGMTRIINPVYYDGKEVRLNVTIASRDIEDTELHTMYVYNEKDIKKFCGNAFKIVDKKETETWQTWYKLRRL